MVFDGCLSDLDGLFDPSFFFSPVSFMTIFVRL